MKATLCLLVLSVAIAIIAAENFYEDENNYEVDDFEDDEEDEYEVTLTEDGELAPYETMLDGWVLLETDDMTIDKRGKKKGKGKKGRKCGKRCRNRKAKEAANAKEKNIVPTEEEIAEMPVLRKGKSKVGPCLNNFGSKPVFCMVCNLKRPETDMSRYLICGGGKPLAVKAKPRH